MKGELEETKKTLADVQAQIKVIANFKGIPKE